MPWVTFTDPQVAGVGLSERAAQAAGFETKTSIVALDQVPRALAARDTRGLIKLVADKTSDRLLGGQIVAPAGADSIQTLVLAIKHGMTPQALGERSEESRGGQECVSTCRYRGARDNKKKKKK